VPRGFGFVHRSKGLFLSRRANPDITIRNFCIAVRQARFNRQWSGKNVRAAQRFDMWSAGVVLLEVLALGSPRVVQLHPRTRTLLDMRLKVRATREDEPVGASSVERYNVRRRKSLSISWLRFSAKLYARSALVANN
jgi:hypothetical protein